MSQKYTGGFITKTPVTPTGPYAEGAASGVWTLDQAMQYTKQGIWPQASNPTPNDPYFQYVTSLLHGDGTNGGQNNTFLDSSTNAFTITRNGNTTQGSFSPYGSNWGNYFPRDGAGTSRQYLYTGSNVSGISGDFTIECWVNFADVTTDNVLFGLGDANSTGFFVRVEYVGATGPNTLNFYAAGDHYVNFPSVLQNGGWNHIAVTRQSNTLKVWLNGVQQSTTHSLSTSFSSDVFYIGAGKLGATVPYNPNKGYMSNVRLVNGTAVYTSNFTPSTTPLTAITNTAVLTCQSNRFIDNSSNNYSIVSATGTSATVQVTRFSPFAPTYATQYSASTIGGSGYFDGTGDYLTAASNSAFAFGSGDFCIEFFVYVSSALSNYDEFVGVYPGSGNPAGWSIFVDTSKYLTFGTHTANLLVDTSAFPTNQWVHVAVSRSGTTLSMYRNGTRVATATDSTSLTQSGLDVMGKGTGNEPNGYMTDLRLVKGSSVYTPSNSTITIPTAPLTAITNTQLLLNYTNGAIYDNAMIPDYETVGNAQISTSVKKYGTGSLAFDGASDYLKAPNSRLYDLGSGNFTLEFWVYHNSITSPTYQMYCGQFNAGGNTPGWNIYKYTNGSVQFYGPGGTPTLTSPNILTASNWYHIAVTRAGSTMKMFINGTEVANTTNTSFTDETSNSFYIGSRSDVIGTYDMNGYIDDLRITKGYARYWENFTPPAAALPNFGGAYQVPTQDPQFNYTTLLLPGNGTNGAQNNTFLDSSTNAFTITRNGNTTQGTFTPFSQTGWGNYFSSSRLNITSSAGLRFDGAFTVEAWINPSSFGTQNFIVNQFTNSGEAGWIFRYTASSLIFYGNAGAVVLNNSTTFIAGQWYHVAVTRDSSNNIRMFVNGTQIGSTVTSSQNLTSTNTAYIGGHADIATDTTGYISNIRVVKGTAVYTSNFTPSTTPLTAITNTQLLTCQSNRFIDNSTNALSITVGSGSPQVQAFSPFAPTAAYSASTVGGSGYFDGTGDYLSLPNNSAFAIGTNDFTFETWAYFTSTPNTQIFCTNDGYGTDSPYGYYYFSYESGAFWSWGGGGGGNTGVSVSYTMPLNQWVHLVAVRSGTSHSIFVNGTRIGNATNQQSYTGGTSPLIGARVNYITGYLSSTRFVNGTAVYNPSSSTLTVPTAPLTNVTNTKLLANYTNAGITDATAKNDLETVGNAQISTTQSKFGGSSLAFDGSGDYLSTKGSPNLAFGTGHFTIEGWFYFNDISSSYNLVGNLDTDDASLGLYYYQPTNKLVLGTYNYDIAYATGVISATTWTHIAATYDGSLYRLFVNGNFVGTTTSTQRTLSNTSTAWQVGALPFLGGRYFNGYMQDVRITKGYARYVQNFTPPAQADQLY